MREFTCCFCLEPVTTVDGSHPKSCPSCKVVTCRCGTHLKEGSAYCYGCGTFCPVTRFEFTAAGSIAGLYAHEGWMARNLGKGLDGFFTVSTHLGPVESDGYHPMMLVKKGNGVMENVRFLTTLEKRRWLGEPEGKD